MACSKWEDSGLLYYSGELNDSDVALFRKHCEECVECRQEQHSYENEKKFFTSENLGETPSLKVDQEILRVCSTYKIKYTGFFPGFIKKSAVSAAFFVVGFAVVSYIFMNVENANKIRSRFIAEVKTTDSLVPHSMPTSSVVTVAVDSSLKGDSLNRTKSNVQFSKSRGDLGVSGVVPVDLQGK